MQPRTVVTTAILLAIVAAVVFFYVITPRIQQEETPSPTPSPAEPEATLAPSPQKTEQLLQDIESLSPSPDIASVRTTAPSGPSDYVIPAALLAITAGAGVVAWIRRTVR